MEKEEKRFVGKIIYSSC